jgi:hypothetical protein
LPDIRARRSPGTAIAAMMPMIATTISSSMSVKPFDCASLLLSLRAFPVCRLLRQEKGQQFLDAAPRLLNAAGLTF